MLIEKLYFGSSTIIEPAVVVCHCGVKSVSARVRDGYGDGIFLGMSIMKTIH
jgi:hypothetical protein